MPDEDNPFLIKPQQKKAEEKKEAFGTDEMISFMATPDEIDKLKHQKNSIEMVTEKPHWEDAGTPIWEKEFRSTKVEKDEVVDHDAE